MRAKEDALASFFYYLRLGLCNQAIQELEHFTYDNGDVDLLDIKFWIAFAHGLAGDVEVAMNQLDEFLSPSPSSSYDVNSMDMINQVDLRYPAIISKLHFCKSKKLDMMNNDDDMINTLEIMEVTTYQDEHSMSNVSLSLSAHISYYLGDLENARKYLERMCEHHHHTSSDRDVLILSSLIELVQMNGNNQVQVFVDLQNLVNTCRDMDGFMILAKKHILYNETKLALLQFNNAISTNPTFLPAHLEKAKLMITMHKFSEATEIMDELFYSRQNSPNVELSRTATFIGFLARDITGDSHKNSQDMLASLLHTFQTIEPRNKILFYDTSRLFARISSSHNKKNILDFCEKLLTQALELDPHNSLFLTELGYQRKLAGEYKLALAAYKDSIRCNGNKDLNALYGTIQCYAFLGDIHEAKQQLEFLKIIMETSTFDDINAPTCNNCDNSNDAEFLYAQAIICFAATNEKDEGNSSAKNVKSTIQFLEMAINKHLEQQNYHEESFREKSATTDTYNIFHQYIMFNMTFGEELAHMLLRNLGDKQKAIDLLCSISSKVPGNLPNLLYLAKAYVESEDFKNALKYIEIASSSSSRGDVYLLSAYMHMKQNDIHNTEKDLNRAISFDFDIRSHLLYCLVKANCFINQNSFKEAKDLLQKAMQELKHIDAKHEKQFPSLDRIVTNTDKLSIYLNLSSVLCKLNEHVEAKNTLIEAERIFHARNFREKRYQISLAQSKLMIDLGKPNSALKYLNRIDTKSSPFYQKAQISKADIFWNHLHDKKAYVDVFRSHIEGEFSSSPSSLMLLGDAYMRVQNFDAAIKVYKEALKTLEPYEQNNNKGSLHLIRKIGRILIATHKYTEAQNYYESALLSSSSSPRSLYICSDLVKLYIKMNKFEEAEKTILNGLKIGSDNGDYDNNTRNSNTTNKINLMLLLVQVLQESGQTKEAIKILENAKELQMLQLDHDNNDSSSERKTQVDTMSRIYYELAQCSKRDLNQCVKYHKAAIGVNPTYKESISALAKLSLLRKEFDECKKYCDLLARVSPDSEEAISLIGDMKFLQSEYDEAIHIYEELLRCNPNNYTVMEKAIQLFRRCGRLNEAVKLFSAAEESNDNRCNHSQHAGLSYAKGLYNRFTNSDLCKSIFYFNQARHDVVWGEKALQNMIEIYLNPNTDTSGGTYFWYSKNIQSKSKYNQMNLNSEENQKTVQELLSELEFIANDKLRTKILEGYFHLSYGNENDATQIFHDILETDKNYIPALMGLTTVYLKQGQEQESTHVGGGNAKARNTLKRIAKIPYQQEFGDEFLACYLNLAEIYMQRNKHDMAKELCERCLVFDKSCSKAWEYIGLMLEKEGDFDNAVICFSKCWSSYHNKVLCLSVGYKLAFYYMKIERNIEAIEVCEEILNIAPHYPGIKENVLFKCL